MYCFKCGNYLPDGSTSCNHCGTTFNSGPSIQNSRPQYNQQAQYSQQAYNQQASYPNPGGMPMAQPVNTNTLMTNAIVVTLLCCLPFGIIAIIFASKANTCMQMQDYYGAEAAAKNAKLFTWLGFGLGLVSSFLYVLVTIASEL